MKTSCSVLIVVGIACISFVGIREGFADDGAPCLTTASASRVTWVSKYEPGPGSAPSKANPEASKSGSDEPKSTKELKRIPEVSLDDAIEVHVTGLKELMKDCDSRIVLFLDGYPIKSLKPKPPTDPSDGRLLFSLQFNDGSGAAPDGQDVNKANEIRQAWTAVLGQAHFSSRPVEVSVGPDFGYPLKVDPIYASQTSIALQVIQKKWLAIWGAIFVVMLAAFLWLARCTNIIRDGNPMSESAVPGAALSEQTQYGPYSLSKSQGAWWFFIIIASYLFIGMITGDFSNSVNSTALTLLGIGAGTVVVSALIDKSKEVQDAPKVQTATIRTEEKIKDLDTEIQAKRTAFEASTAAAKEVADTNSAAATRSATATRVAIEAQTAADAKAAEAAKATDGANAAAAEQAAAATTARAAADVEVAAAARAAADAQTAAAAAAALESELQTLIAEKEKSLSDYRKLTRQNEWFPTDILSDADGVSFHRFQMVGWTVVLGLVFVKDVYYTLAMPIFDTTLLGLLGLSAGTYLGLKIPEATTPKK